MICVIAFLCSSTEVNIWSFVFRFIVEWNKQLLCVRFDRMKTIAESRNEFDCDFKAEC